jgi:hypothetical protein
VTVKTAAAAIRLRLATVAFAAGVLALLSGCRTADVQRHTEQVQPTVTAGEPAYIIHSQPGKTEPWYRELQVVIDHKPESEKETESIVAEHKAEISDASVALLEEVRKAVDEKRKPTDKWSLISMTCGRPKKGPEIQFNTDVALTKLYARRPVIAFNNVPLDICIAKLSRETGMQDAQPRNYNPRIFWSKTNVTAFEAIDDILKQNGFEKRISDAFHRVTLRLQDYKTRGEFVEAAVENIINKGKALNEARPAIVVTPKEKQSGDKEPKEKKGAKSAPASSKDAPAPPPPDEAPAEPSKDKKSGEFEP